MGWAAKSLELRDADTGELVGTFNHKRAVRVRPASLLWGYSCPCHHVCVVEAYAKRTPSPLTSSSGTWRHEEAACSLRRFSRAALARSTLCSTELARAPRPDARRPGRTFFTLCLKDTKHLVASLTHNSHAPGFFNVPGLSPLFFEDSSLLLFQWKHACALAPSSLHDSGVSGPGQPYYREHFFIKLERTPNGWMYG